MGLQGGGGVLTVQDRAQHSSPSHGQTFVLASRMLSTVLLDVMLFCNDWVTKAAAAHADALGI